MAITAIKGALRVPIDYGKNRASELVERVRPYAKSILGNWILCFSLETTGAICLNKAGRPLGKMVVSHATPILAPYAMQTACVAAMVFASANLAIRPSQLHLAILVTTAALSILQITYLSYGEFNVEGPEWVGERLGEVGGTVLGGYLGLRLAGRLIQKLEPEPDKQTRSERKIAFRPYAKGTLRYESAGYLFNATIFPATYFWVIPLRGALKAICQGAAYSAPQIEPLVRGCLRGQAKSALLPFVVQTCFREYCDANSVQLSDQLLRRIIPSSSFLPNVLEEGARKLTEAVVKFNALPKKTGELTAIAMRGLHGYMALLELEPTKTALQNYRSNPRIYENAFRKALKEAIPGASKLSPFFDKILKTTLDEWSEAIVTHIQEAEQTFIGCNVLQVAQLKSHLNLHLKYYFLYVLLNHDTCIEPMNSKEEEEFFVDANHAFFSLISASLPKSLLIAGSRVILDVGIRTLYGLRRSAANFKATSSQQHTQLFSYANVETDYMTQEKPTSPVSPVAISESPVPPAAPPPDDFVLLESTQTEEEFCLI